MELNFQEGSDVLGSRNTVGRGQEGPLKPPLGLGGCEQSRAPAPGRGVRARLGGPRELGGGEGAVP